MVSHNMRMAAAASLLLLLTAGCSGTREENERMTLSVFAASSLTDVMPDLVEVFQGAHPDVDVAVTFAGSQVLRFQIEQGASADVFASANEAHMRALEDAGHVIRSRALAATDLVVVVPLANGAAIERFDQLAQATRIVVGTPFVPIGAYADTVLSKASAVLGEDFAADVRDRIASMESNVRLVRAKVELGEADAALVYRTDAMNSDRVGLVPIPDAFNVQAQFWVGVTMSSPRGDEAGRFLDFLSSPPAREIFRAHGFRSAGS